MSFKFSAAHSSRIKKASKPPSFKRSASTSSPYSSLPRRKPLQRSSTKPEAGNDEDEDEDLFEDRLDDIGLVKALATDLTLRDVAQAIIYIRNGMWSAIPQQAGMNSTRIAEVLNFRISLPPIVTVSHITALLNSPTLVEREILELTRGGAVRKIVVGTRNGMGESLIMVKDLEDLIQKSDLEQVVKDKFTALLHENPTALQIPRSNIADSDVKALMHAGFLTSSLPLWTTTDAFSRPGQGSHGTMTSLNSISKAASGSMAAVGGEGAVHFSGGSGGGVKLPGSGGYSLALPATGPFLKLLANARAHLLMLLAKSKYREIPESLLKQRWDGGIDPHDTASISRKIRGEFAGVLPGRTRKWKHFYGITFEWILGECVGAGLIEVFDTGTAGRGGAYFINRIHVF